MAGQIQLNFNGDAEDGFEIWQRELRERRAVVARKLGLPLGERAEIELACGQVLTGRLRLRDNDCTHTNPRDAELEIDGVPFQLREVVASRKLD